MIALFLKKGGFNAVCSNMRSHYKLKETVRHARLEVIPNSLWMQKAKWMEENEEFCS
jgi:hypothetical protein